MPTSDELGEAAAMLRGPIVRVADLPEISLADPRHEERLNFAVDLFEAPPKRHT